MHADSDDSLQLDEICDEFEFEWREGRIPDIADWCRLVDPVIQPALRCRLIAIDSSYRSQADLTELTRLDQPEQTSPVPESIGGCRILQEIARGGMGVVYKAWQPGVNRTVAVKLLYPSANGGTSIRQFQAEAAADGRLQHSGIVRVNTAEEENNTRYLIMEFVDGPNLNQPGISSCRACGHRSGRCDSLQTVATSSYSVTTNAPSASCT